jgi:hypothetical protein
MAERPRLAGIPVLLLSGALDPVDNDRVKEVGAIGVIVKPLQPGLVVRQVSERLAARRAGAAPAQVPVAAAATALLSTPMPVVEQMSPVPSTVVPFAPPSPPPPAVASPPPQRSAATQALDDYFASLDEAINARAARILESPLPSAAPSSTPRDDDGEARPLLASAFSALLDAESAGEEDAELASWFVVPSQPVAPAITDDLIEQVTRRVLSRLSDRIVRETVADLVSRTAERLVADEIERIKSHIK